MEIADLLREVIDSGATDLILVGGLPPMLRLSSELTKSRFPALNPETLQNLIFGLLTPSQKEKLEREKELDISYEVSGVGRFRVNLHFERGALAAALRPIPSQIPSLEELNLPGVIEDFCKEVRGLVLVTGPTGCGKSTTLASMIEIINNRRAAHIITIEDPIEYVYQNKKSIIEQREVGADTNSFDRALKHVLRQNPDVILVGEMRDLETMATAITAAETGHLVLSTLHTNDSVQAIDRMIDVFPPHQQGQVRIQLSLCLSGVIAQQLLARADGKGLVPAVEILKATLAVKNLIRKAATHEIYSLIEIGGKFGMQNMDSSLKNLYQKGLIVYEEALSHALNPENLMRLLA